MTILDIIKRAYKITGLLSGFQNLRSEDAIDALTELNGILDTWNVDKLKSYNQVNNSYTLVANQSKYTVGTGGDFDGDRPVRIEYMFVRDNAGYDHGMKCLSFDEFESIKLKSIKSDYPRYYYYNPKYPLGELEVYPVPSKSYDLHITQWYKWGGYLTTALDIDLPPGYIDLLIYELAIALCPYFGKQVPTEVFRKHAELDYKISNLNASQWVETISTDVPSSYNSSYGIDRTYIPTPFK